jgi:hypothetical protein
VSQGLAQRGWDGTGAAHGNAEVDRKSGGGAGTTIASVEFHKVVENGMFSIVAKQYRLQNQPPEDLQAGG